MRSATLAALLLMVFSAIGCSSTRTLTFDVTVRNETEHPITIWLTKDGPPWETAWLAPEHIASRAPGHEERIGGILVPPGKTAYTGEIQGEFAPGSYAWVRVYDGQYRDFSDLLAVGPRSVNRVDHALDEGRNLLVVRRISGRIAVEDEGEGVTMPGAR